MPSVVTLPAKRNQLEQELIARITIGKMMNIYSLSHPAALANPLGTQQHKLPPLLPLIRLQVTAVTRAPVCQQPHLLAVEHLGEESAALRTVSRTNLMIPKRERVYLRRLQGSLANGVTDFVAAPLALFTNLNRAIRLNLLAARRLLVGARKCGIRLFTNGGIVRFCVCDTHRAAPVNARDRLLPTAKKAAT